MMISDPCCRHSVRCGETHTSLNSFSRTLSFMVFFSVPLSALAFLVLALSISAFCRATYNTQTIQNLGMRHQRGTLRTLAK